jgi:very-short-patch-repair endonuclease
MHRAGELRHDHTPAEAKLWSYLRAHRAEDVHFRGQHACPEPVEGPSAHTSPISAPRAGNWSSKWTGVSTSTRKNMTFLEAQGYKILRFWNGDVMKNIEGVLGVILEELEGLEGLTEEAPEVRGREVRIVERE